MIDKVKAQSRHRKNTDQNTTKIPILIVLKNKRFIFASLKCCNYEILT